jgi:Cu2+-containing amine oxidase
MRWNIAILPMAMTLTGCVGVETMPMPRGNGGPAAHPLDPLTAGEIDAAVAILKTAGKLPEGAFFPILVLREPPKAEVLAWKPAARCGVRHSPSSWIGQRAARTRRS